MKWIKLLVPIIVIAMVFTGCSFRLASSVDELISPVAPAGDNADVQNALDSYCKGGFSLKTPVGGEYTTSYIFYDVDADGEDEAVAFYEPASNLGTINMAVIDKVDNQWSVVSNIEGDGADIYSVNFGDLNGDEIPEFIVLWDVIANSSNHVLSVYTQQSANKDTSLVRSGKELPTNEYTIVDIDSDGVNEIMMFTLDAGDSITAYANLYSYSKGAPKLLAKTKLDGHIISYKNIISEKVNGTVYVYADAINLNGSQMHTEVIYWSDNYDSIISPFYSYSTGVTKNTVRNAMLTSRDINGDGFVEIPLDAEMEGVPTYIEAVNWKQYKGSVLDHVSYSIAVQKDNYQIIIPDDYFDKISVTYDPSNAVLTVKDKDDNVVFSVLSLLKSHYDENIEKYSGYTEIMNKSGYIYLANTDTQSDIKFTTDDLKSMIKSYKGE